MVTIRNFYEKNNYAPLDTYLMFPYAYAHV